MKTYELIAPCHFGLEAVLKREIDDLGYDISKTEDGRVISTFQVIENAINDILGKDRSNKSGLYLSLLNEISTEENKATGRYDWKISSANLYPILELYFADKLKEAGIPNAKSFKELSNDSIIKLIHELFANDVKLM